MKKRFAILATTAILFSIPASVCFPRIWTDRHGRSAEANFISLDANIVKLQRPSDGRIFDVPIERLSDADQSFAKSATQGDGRKSPPQTRAVFAAFSARAKEQVEFTAEQLNASDRIVCVWKKGTAQTALKTIDEVGLKVVYLGAAIPFGVCTGKLTEDGLKKLKSDQSIESVEPDIELVVDDDEAREITDEVLAAYEHAGRMACVCKNGKKEQCLEFLARMEKEGKLRVIHKLETLPIAFCDWKSPLQKETLVQLQQSPLLDYVEPDLALLKDNATQGREIEYPNGTPKTVVTSGGVLTTPDDPEMGKLRKQAP